MESGKKQSDYMVYIFIYFKYSGNSAFDLPCLFSEKYKKDKEIVILNVANLYNYKTITEENCDYYKESEP